MGSSRERGGPPAGERRGAETPSPGGWGAFVFCVELGRSLGFCPCSLGMRLGGEGARPAVGFSPGCERGDNRRREPSSASTARRARLFRGPHCLKKSEAGGARAPEGRRPPTLPGASWRWSRAALGTPSVGGGHATKPSAATLGLRVREVFLAGVGGVDCRALPAREGRGHPGGPLAPPILSLPTRAGSRV